MSYQNIDTLEFKKRIADDDSVVVLDVRTPQEVSEGCVENSINIDYNAGAFIEKVSQLDKSKSYYVYCRSGKRSRNACDLMTKLGFKTVYNLDKGFLDWS